jgi:hypothetical protein
MRLAILLYALVIALWSDASTAKTIDYDALEKQWESGDMDEELLPEEALAAYVKDGSQPPVSISPGTIGPCV